MISLTFLDGTKLKILTFWDYAAFELSRREPNATSVKFSTYFGVILKQRLSILIINVKVQCNQKILIRSISGFMLLGEKLATKNWK